MSFRPRTAGFLGETAETAAPLRPAAAPPRAPLCPSLMLEPPAAVRAGTYRVGPLAPGAAADLEVRVTAATAAGGSTHTVDLTARSVANPIARDTVRASASVPAG